MENEVSPNSGIAELLHRFFLLCKQLSLHDEKNAVVQGATDQFMQQLKRCCSQGVINQIGVAKYSFLIGGKPLNPHNRLLASFSFRMFQHGISSFILTPELKIDELYSFLRLIMKKSSETWDHGGIGQCMAQHGIESILVTEMSKSDFSLLEGNEGNESLEYLQSSDKFWNAFARTILSIFSEPDRNDFDIDGADPQLLAEKISELFDLQGVADKAGKQRQILQTMNRSILAAQGQKVASEKAASYLKLAEFVSRLETELRREIVAGICNMQMLKANAELFFDGCSDDAILEAFRQVSQKKSYSPPVIVSLVSKLASDRKIVSEMDLALLHADREERLKNAKELLRSDDFRKYVPERYQQTLKQVLSDPQLPQTLTKNLILLKSDLETFRLEEKIAQISLHILELGPDSDYLPAVHKQLISVMEYLLAVSDYTRLLELCRRSFANRSRGAIDALIACFPESFYTQLLKDIAYLKKEDRQQVSELIALLGPAIVQPLLQELATEKDRGVRQLLLNSMRKIGMAANVSAEVVKYLKDSRWYVVRNMLLLLGKIGKKDDLPHIRPLLKHSHLRVRQEAIKSCLLLKDTVFLKELSKQLSSKNREEVLHAVTLAGLVKMPDLIDKMLSMLSKEKIFTFDFQLKKALVMTLAKQRETRALKVFQRKLQASRFVHAGAYKLLKIEIIKALQHYPAHQALPLLQQQINEGTAAAVLQAKQVMAKLGGASDR